MSRKMPKTCLDKWFSNINLRKKEGERRGGGGGQTFTGDDNGEQSRLSFPLEHGGESMEDRGRARSHQGNREEEEEEEGDWRVTRHGRA